MENLENTVDNQDETQEVEMESEEVQEETPEQDDDSNEEGEADELAEIREENEKLKAESAKLQRLLNKKPKTVKQPPSSLSVEETVLKANGRSEEQIDFLRKVAHVQDISLIDAEKDPLYVSWQTQQEEQAKAKEARLGASRGSSKIHAQKAVSDSGLTRDDHKALALEAMRR